MKNACLIPKILFEDPHLMVVDKPAGLLSQGDHGGDPSLVDWARAHVGRNYVGLVHRLDRNTSGIMVLAKRTKAARRLTEALQEGSLQRIYLACLWGKLQSPQKWRHWLLKDPKKNTVRVVSKGTAKSQEAVLKVTPMIYGDFRNTPMTLAIFELETGRSHQIRAQAFHEGFPLAGDSKYGGQGDERGPFSRPALHSLRLKFPHPMTGEIRTFQASWPGDFQKINWKGRLDPEWTGEKL